MHKTRRRSKHGVARAGDRLSLIEIACRYGGNKRLELLEIIAQNHFLEHVRLRAHAKIKHLE